MRADVHAPLSAILKFAPIVPRGFVIVLSPTHFSCSSLSVLSLSLDLVNCLEISRKLPLRPHPHIVI
ncbi:hypothetical protein L6452_12663 [Arctium lappa]|uniref:Uncharacterized protein n=1 Tax=Arctium lappa TaxID=4217 RepID=A0ACB9DRL8_ARCLA|nr:hypothetical protein L6452_12663 [Arctium lappa]